MNPRSPLLLLWLFLEVLSIGRAGPSKRIPAGSPAPGKDWAFQPLKRPAIPQSGLAPRVSRNPIDAFIRAKLAGHGLTPAPEADQRTLLRRVYYDLIGLPPAPERLWFKPAALKCAASTANARV